MADTNFDANILRQVENISKSIETKVAQKVESIKEQYKLQGTTNQQRTLEQKLNNFTQFYENIKNMGQGLTDAQAQQARKSLYELHPSGENLKRNPALAAAYQGAVSALNAATDDFLPEASYATPEEAKLAMLADEEYRRLKDFEKMAKNRLKGMKTRIQGASKSGALGAKSQKKIEQEQAKIITLFQETIPDLFSTAATSKAPSIRTKTSNYGKTIRPKITIEKGFEKDEPDREIMDIKGMSEALMSQMSAAQKEAFEGREVRNRFGKFGKDVSSVANIGRGLGTSLSKFEQVIKEARENGYKTVVRYTSDGYEMRFIPESEYDEKKKINWDDKKNKLQIKVGLSENGRIGGKIDAISVATEYIKGKNGQKGSAYTLLESSAARQLDGVIGFLKSDKFKSGSMTVEESSSFMQHLVNSAVSGDLPLVAGDAKSSEYFARNKIYSGEKTGTEIIKSLEVSFQDFVANALRNEKIQEVITNYKRKTNKKFKFNPEHVTQDVMTAMTDAFIRAGRYGEDEIAQGLNEDTLLKALVENDAMRYYLRGAKKIIGATGISMTARSEGGYANQKYGGISQANITPLTIFGDWTQRDTAQGLNVRELTARAKESRKNLSSPIFTVAGAEESGFNYQDSAQKLYQVMQIPESEFYKAAEAYFKSIGFTGDALKLSLQSLMDTIIPSKELIEGTESYRYAASRSTAENDINSNFLKQYGIDLKKFKNAEVGDVIEIGREVGISDDKAFSKQFQTKMGDVVTALVRTIDGWALQTQALSASEQGTKMVLQLGGRMGVGGGTKPAEMFSYIQNYLMQNWAKNDGQREAIQNAQAFVEERTELKERNFILDFAGQLNTIVDAMKKRGNSNEQIYEALVKQNPIFAKIFDKNLRQNVSYDFKDERFVDSEGFGVFNPNETATLNRMGPNGVITTEIVTQGQKLLAGLDELGQNLLGQDYDKIKGLLSTGIGQQDVAVWAKTSGGGNFTPRVSNDFKVINAGKRTRAFFGGLAMQGKNAEEKAALQNGLDIIKAAHEELNTNLSPAEKAAREDLNQIVTAWKSFDYRTPYQKTGAGKDIEFVSKSEFSTLEENQIYIEDTVTDLREAIEKGRVKPEDYDKFIMEVARKRQSSLIESGKNEYANANFVLNRAQGGKLMFANVESGKDKDYNFYISALEKQQGQVLKAYAEFASATEEQMEEKEAAYKEALYNLQELYVEVATNKDSKLVHQATHVAQGHSGYGIAQGRAFDTSIQDYSEENAKLANTVVISADRLRSMYASEARSNKKQILENVKALAHQYNLRTGNNFAEEYFTRKGKFSRTSKNDLIATEERIIGMIIDAIKQGNSNFAAEMGRFPYNQGTEGIMSHIAIGDVGDEVVSVSQGLAKYLHGDFDGDYFRMISNVFNSTYGKNAYNMEKEMQKLQDKYVWIMQQFANAEKMGGASDKQAKLLDIAKTLEDKSINEFASIFAGSSFQNIGTFSQSATKMRENMAKLGYDTRATATDEDLKKSFNADIIKAFLQTLEQDAISSKKIYARLEQIKKEKGEDFSLEQAGDEVWHLIKTLRDGDFTGFVNEAINMGIYKDMMSDQPIQSLRARWMSNDRTKDFLKSYVGEDFVSMNADAGLSSEFVIGAFNDVNNYLNSRFKGKNLNIGDLITDSWAWQNITGTTYNGTPVSNKMYHRTREGVQNSSAETENGTNIAGTGAVIDSNGTVIINTTGNVFVNAQGDINTTQIIKEMANAAKQGIEQGTASTLKNDNGKIIHEMRDESGRYVSPEVTWTGVTPPDQKTHAMTVKMNGKLYGKDDIFSVTEALNHEAPLKSWDQEKLHASSVMGTYAHRIAQELVNTGESSVDSFSDSVNSELKEIIGKSVSEGGLNMTSSDPKAQKQRQLAELAVAKAREAGIVNDNTITERTMAGLFGQQMFAGTMDALTYNKDTGFAVNDWKFSKSGGPEDIQKRGERMLQMQVYFTMYEKALEKLSNQVFEEGKEITAEDAKWFGLEGNDSAEWANDLTERLNHIRKGNVKFANTRAFEQNGQQIVEIVTSGLNVAMSMEEVAEILDKGIKGEAIPWDEIAKKYGVDSIKASLFSVNGSKLSSEVPPVVQEMINKRNAERPSGGSGYNTKSINDYLKQYKQILKIQEQIDADEKRLASSGMKGERADNIRSVVNMRKRLLGQLQAEVPNLDLEKGELNGQKLSEEELIKLKKEIALLDSNHGIQLEKNNALQKQSVGLVQQIANGFKASFRNLTDYSLAYAVIGKIRMAYSQLINYAEQLNASMVDLQIASGLSYSNIKNMMLDFNDIAVKVGKSTLEVSQAANDWLRAGYEGQDAATLVENSMQLSTLGMINSAEATEYLISMLKGWKLQVKEVSSIVDKLVAVDMSAAISARDLATALARANTSAQLAGKICA